MNATRGTLVRITLLALICLGLLLPADSPAQEKRYVFTAQEVGTALYMMTTNVTNVVTRYLPKDVKLDILPSGAVVASCTMVNDGKAHFGWAEPSAVWAVNGQILYTKKHENLRAIAGGLQFANLQAFALKKWADEKKIATLEDLKARKVPVRIVTKKKGTMGQAAAPLQLEAYGITYDNIKAWGGQIVETGVPEIVDMMKDGRADLWLDNLAPGHPAATELYQSVDLTIIEHTPQGMEYMKKYGFYPQPVPANTWKGQAKEIQQPGGVTLMTTHKDIPTELVYTVTKALGENAEEIRKAHAVMKHFDEKIAWRQDRALIALHPGAEKYYREAGLLK